MKKISKNITDVYSKIKSPFKFCRRRKSNFFKDEKLSLEDVAFLKKSTLFLLKLLRNLKEEIDL